MEEVQNAGNRHQLKDKMCSKHLPDPYMTQFKRLNQKKRAGYIDDLEEYYFENMTEISQIDRGPINFQNEGCIFMVNVSQNGELLAISTCKQHYQLNRNIHLSQFLFFAHITESNQLEIWNTQSQVKLRQLTAHSEIVTGIVKYTLICKIIHQNNRSLFFHFVNQKWFFQNPSFFATCSIDQSIQIWKDFECINTLNDHTDWLRCLSITNDDKFMISGCVSSQVLLWDLEKFIPIKEWLHYNQETYLNSVNTLSFMNDDNQFLCGTRDGYIRLYDLKSSNSCFNVNSQMIQTHTNQLNFAYFKQNDYEFLSSGRDSVIRLWDIRYIQEPLINGDISEPVLEYTGHKCKGYNISAQFINNEQHIITGSQDNSIYIYNAFNGKVKQVIHTKSQINHIVHPIDNRLGGQFIFSGLQENVVHFYGPWIKQKDYYAKQEEQTIERPRQDLGILEEVMSEYGDLILKVFHKNNFTYSSPLSWETLVEMVENGNDNQSQQILSQFQQSLQLQLKTHLENRLREQMRRTPILRNEFEENQNQLDEMEEIRFGEGFDLEDDDDMDQDDQNDYLDEYTDHFGFLDLDQITNQGYQSVMQLQSNSANSHTPSIPIDSKNGQFTASDLPRFYCQICRKRQSLTDIKEPHFISFNGNPDRVDPNKQIF